jgi:hypothetical protein
MAVPKTFADAGRKDRSGADLLLDLAQQKHAAATPNARTNEENLARAQRQQWNDAGFDQRSGAPNPTR